MESSTKILFNLKQFFYHSNNYEWTSEMPFFWFCFFKIDGTNCKMNKSLQMEGKVSLYTTLEKIENLNNFESDKSDIIRIPDFLGKKEITLEPIPVPEFIRESTLKKPEPQVGCAMVFMDRNCFFADSQNELPSLLTEIIQKKLNESIPNLNKSKNTLINKTPLLANLLETTVLEATQKHKPFWHKFISSSRADATVWKFSANELEELNSISLTKNWVNEGTWELSGSITIENGNPHPTFSKKNYVFTKKKATKLFCRIR